MKSTYELFMWARIILREYEKNGEFITQHKLCTILYLFDNILEVKEFEWKYELTPDLNHITIPDLPGLSIAPNKPITDWKKICNGSFVINIVLKKILGFVINKWGYSPYSELNKVVFENGSPPNLCQKFEKKEITSAIIKEYFNHKL